MLAGEDNSWRSLPGTDKSNFIFGSENNDQLFGLGGNDELCGGAGDDTLVGGPGADILEGDLAGFTIDLFGDRVFIEGGPGLDTASYEDATAGVRASFRVPSGNTGDAAGDSYSQIENLKGSAFNDTLEGDNEANRLIGSGGNDLLIGNSGADLLEGGSEAVPATTSWAVSSRAATTSSTAAPATTP